MDAHMSNKYFKIKSQGIPPCEMSDKLICYACFSIICYGLSQNTKHLSEYGAMKVCFPTTDLPLWQIFQAHSTMHTLYFYISLPIGCNVQCNDHFCYHFETRVHLKNLITVN